MGEKGGSLSDNGNIGTVSSITADLSYLAPEKMIKGVKRQFFDKYKVLPAFPKAVIFPDDKIQNMVDEYVTQMESLLDDYFTLKETDKLMHKALDFKALTECGNFDRKLWAEKLAELYSISFNDKDLKEINDYIQLALKELNPNNGQMDKAKVDEYIGIVNSLFDSLLQSVYSPEDIPNAFANLESAIKNAIHMIVDGSVEPKYRDSVRHKMNAWMKNYLNNSSSEVITSSYNDLVDEITKRHISKVPIKLLQEYVKELQKSEPDKHMIALYRNNMEETLNVAKRSRFEYFLMNSVDDGLATKMPLLLSSYCFRDKNGERFEITTEEGMMKIITLLSANGSNTSTLNLFLTQTGLTERAVEVITSVANFEELKKQMNVMGKLLFVHLNFIVTLKDLYKEFLKDNNIKYSSLQDVSEHWLKYIEQNKGELLEGEELEGDRLEFAESLYKTYVKGMKNDVNSNNSRVSGAGIIPTFKQINEYAFESINDSLNGNLQSLRTLSDFFLGRFKVLSSIEVCDPELNRKKQAYATKVEEVIDLYKSISDEVILKANKVQDMAS